MKLLLYDMGAYTQNDIMTALANIGVRCKNVLYRLTNLNEDAFFEKRMNELIQKEVYDAVFSVNYYPIVAKICSRFQIPYISWSYDSPINISNIEETLGYPTNYVFFFDRQECKKYRRKGYQNVFHLPLAVNTSRIDHITYKPSSIKGYGAEVSMVGQLYDTSLEGLILPLKEYEKGYLTAILETQMKLYGRYILNDVISDEMLERINQTYASIGQKEYKLTKSGLVTAMAKYITHLERTILLETLGEMTTVHLYGPDPVEKMSNVLWHGSAGYFDEMPQIFKESKINLNVTLKCIESGIPLRVLDIMGSGGFVLTNYQSEIAENFVDGEELAVYSSLEEAVDKCRYFLSNDRERERIAEKGYQKVKSDFTYEKRIQEMLSIVFR